MNQVWHREVTVIEHLHNLKNNKSQNLILTFFSKPLYLKCTNIAKSPVFLLGLKMPSSFNISLSITNLEFSTKDCSFILTRKTWHLSNSCAVFGGSYKLFTPLQINFTWFLLPIGMRQWFRDFHLFRCLITHYARTLWLPHIYLQIS